MTGFMYVEERDALKGRQEPVNIHIMTRFKSRSSIRKKKKSLNLLWAPIVSINYSLSFLLLEMEQCSHVHSQ
jgi:hypothetical protein